MSKMSNLEIGYAFYIQEDFLNVIAPVDFWCTKIIKQRNKNEKCLPINFRKIMALKKAINECFGDYLKTFHEKLSKEFDALLQEPIRA